MDYSAESFSNLTDRKTFKGLENKPSGDFDGDKVQKWPWSPVRQNGVEGQRENGNSAEAARENSSGK